MDLAEFTSEYVRILRDHGTRLPSRKKLAEEIASAYGEYVPETEGMDDAAYRAWAREMAPQVEYYLN